MCNLNTDNFNRAHDRRNNEGWIARQLKNKNSVFIPVYNLLMFFDLDKDIKPKYLLNNFITEYKISYESFIFLGMGNDIPYFTIELNENSKTLLNKHGHFIELRKALPNLSEFDRTILLHSRAMSHWHSRHKFCGTCGSPTISKEAGNLLVCTNENCKQSHFPRTDPAIIVLVTKNDKCLLGHSKGWQGNRYSTLAGFVEPGESLEETVKREVFEESGIVVKNIKYFSSQPWPFPSSLMLGFTADAENENIVINKDELESVLWFSREEIKEKLVNGKIKMPGKVSIAFKLIGRWFDDKGFGKLSEIAGDD